MTWMSRRVVYQCHPLGHTTTRRDVCPRRFGVISTWVQTLCDRKVQGSRRHPSGPPKAARKGKRLTGVKQCQGKRLGPVVHCAEGIV